MITRVRPQGIMQVSANGGEPELIVRALEGETLASPQVLPDRKSILFARQLTFDPADDDGPVWLPAGDRIYFRSFRDGDEDHGGLYTVSVGGGTPDKIAMSDDFPYALPWSISSDGKTLALVNGKTVTDVDVARLDRQSGATFIPLLSTPRIENEPVIAPNGRWIAYQEGTANGLEINIRPFPDVDRQRFSVGPGMNPVFSRDGSELFFFDGQGISVVPVTYEPAFRIGTPQSLFKGEYWYGVAGADGNLGRTWDVDPTGERFLMIRVPGLAPAAAGEAQPSQAPPVRVNVVINWLEELKRLVPAR